MITLTCPECASEVSLSPRRLMVRVDADRAVGGELLFTCLGCDATPTVSLEVADLAALVRGGVTHLSPGGAGVGAGATPDRRRRRAPGPPG